MTKFTPGPWEKEYALLNGEPIYSIGPSENMEDYRVAMVFDEAGGDDSTHEANAHLIASAPDMYEFIRKFLEDDWIDKEIFKEAYDILAKARGET